MTPLRLSAFPSRRAGFTMTEIALCIAVVSIALVAIIGVLPSGLNVQRQNREDTIVTEDSKVLLNALRTGSTLNADLTNYVDFILYDRYLADDFGRPKGTPTRYAFRGFHWNEPGLKAIGYPTPVLLTNTAQILALMTAERVVTVDKLDYVNVVRAQVRAISGNLTEKPMRPNPNSTAPGPDGLRLSDRTDFSFRYLVTVEVSPVPVGPNFTGGPAAQQQVVATAQQVRDVALTFQWPVVIRPAAKRGEETLRVGHGRRIVRTQVYGHLQPAIDESNYTTISSLKVFSPNSL